jgi:hypothetical protein
VAGGLKSATTRGLCSSGPICSSLNACTLSEQQRYASRSASVAMSLHKPACHFKSQTSNIGCCVGAACS